MPSTISGLLIVFAIFGTLILLNVIGYYLYCCCKKIRSKKHLNNFYIDDFLIIAEEQHS